MERPRDTPRAPNDDGTAVLSRLSTIVDGLDLDCDCRDRLSSSLRRFIELEQTRHRASRLRAAREDVARIVSLLSLLRDLDDIGHNEPDSSVYSELAHLLQDISEAAQDAAARLHSLDRP